ncbi:unnamed protein product [Blepharisma stoltei]|uniref:Ran guanine nucleotide release factor n=1 Tax=Blepharisma stoltei TaxID=1481888 RepID=A0AAU9IAA3_9CILI|nr:unnamed protein product [Blepharisma stoltei]
MDIQFSSKQLYGGAIEAEFPSSVSDLSQVTFVPDNQEVFTDLNTEATLILDLLERAECQDENSAAYHYNDLAGQNESSGPGQSTIISTREISPQEMPNIPADWKKYIIKGQMLIKPDKGQFTDRDLVNILMLIIRIAEVETDIVFHINLPVKERIDQENAMIEKYFKRFMESFKINDMGLFG